MHLASLGSFFRLRLDSPPQKVAVNKPGRKFSQTSPVSPCLMQKGGIISPFLSEVNELYLWVLVSSPRLQVTGREEVESDCARGVLEWILGKIYSLEGW